MDTTTTTAAPHFYGALEARGHITRTQAGELFAGRAVDTGSGVPVRFLDNNGSLTLQGGEAVATSDGLPVNRARWCSCPHGETDPVYFEAYRDNGTWTGRHGWACRSCRALVQTG